MLESWDEVRSAMRRRMRLFAPLGRAAARPANSPLARKNADREQQRRREDAERKAIVSVHGEDLSSEDEIGAARPERDESAA